MDVLFHPFQINEEQEVKKSESGNWIGYDILYMG